jgi:hypothetical protein
MAQIRWRRVGDQVSLAILEPEEIIAELQEQHKQLQRRHQSMARYGGVLMGALAAMTLLAILGWAQVWGWM